VVAVEVLVLFQQAVLLVHHIQAVQVVQAEVEAVQPQTQELLVQVVTALYTYITKENIWQ
jgi:hypothetical protein